jgi:formylglycine-generating enzyme
MQSSSSWARLAIGSVSLSLSIAACDSVLDIEDPKTRPSEAGAAGEPTTGATDAGGSSSGSTSTTPQGGAGEGGGGGALNEGGAGAGAGGEGGAPLMKDCVKDAVQCGGADGKTPQICDDTGHWIANTNEAEGDCPILCAAGKCTECADSEARCKDCASGATDCNSNLPQTCIDGEWVDDQKPCTQVCSKGACETAKSCDAANTERTTCAGSQSCCLSQLVPGGEFLRDYDGADYADDTHPAKISAFYLDKFEVTVGRMRQFVSAFDAIKISLEDGDGKSPHIADDTGWDEDYALPSDKAALIEVLKSEDCPGATWSDDLVTNNDLPINCVPFNIAYAFCVWDGGRLPTEAEWNFAAAGGDEQRVYPWKAPPAEDPPITDEHANYGNAHTGPIAVGSKPTGNGRWGQADLAGNVSEWLLDYYSEEYEESCVDCLNATPGTDRSERGGSYISPWSEMMAVSVPGYAAPGQLDSFRGFRCARDPDTL